MGEVPRPTTPVWIPGLLSSMAATSEAVYVAIPQIVGGNVETNPIDGAEVIGHLLSTRVERVCEITGSGSWYRFVGPADPQARVSGAFRPLIQA